MRNWNASSQRIQNTVELIPTEDPRSRFTHLESRRFCRNQSTKGNMLFQSSTSKWLLGLGSLVALSLTSLAQPGYIPEGGEYSIAGSLPGDQVVSYSSLNSSKGFIVWEDNLTDGSGQGISARKIDATLTGQLSPFPVNSLTTGEQEKPKAAVLDNGGAVFVWQGGPRQAQQIYARFLSSSNTWLTANDVLVNSYTNSHHLDATVTKLLNGNVVIAWASFDQDGSYQGAYARLFSPTGTALSGEIQIAQTTLLNQRTPSLAALNNGQFVATWVSEKRVADPSGIADSRYLVSIFGRLFNANGSAGSAEFQVNTGSNVCANPCVAASPSGGYTIVWGEKDSASPTNNSWDIYARTFSNSGSGAAVARLNTVQYGDQYAPKIAANPNRYLAVWTSLGQDGSWEGVYGQFLNPNGGLEGGEFRINTSTLGRQMMPSVSANGTNRFLVQWATFVGGAESFDLHAQRYVDQNEPLAAPNPPIVSALSSTRLGVTWPPVSGLDVDHYELYVDGTNAPVLVSSNMWVNSQNYYPGSTHTFRLAYVLADGRTSPKSDSGSGTTWGYDENLDGLPDDWQALYWGSNPANWPSPDEDSDGDGASNRKEFLAGTDPTNGNSVLRVDIVSTSQGPYLKWNTHPGFLYQLLISTNFGSWTGFGGPRFAFGTEDSVYIGGINGAYYQAVRLR